MRRWRIELERCFSKNSFSACSEVGLGIDEIFSRNSTMPSERVGPGRTVLTVTAVPLVSSARPRAIASWEDLLTPEWIISAGVEPPDPLREHVAVAEVRCRLL